MIMYTFHFFLDKKKLSHTYHSRFNEDLKKKSDLNFEKVFFFTSSQMHSQIHIAKLQQSAVGRSKNPGDNLPPPLAGLKLH